MKLTTQYKNFLISEAMGVARPTQFYLQRLTYLVIDKLYKFSDEMRASKTLNTTEPVLVDIVMNYRDIKYLVSKSGEEFYLDFPLSQIILSLELSKKEMNRPYTYLVGGSASPFARGGERYATRFKPEIKQAVDHSLSIHMGMEIIIGQNFRKINQDFSMFENTHLFKKIESVISHELNHLYEFYRRKISGAKSIEASMTWASIGENVYGVSDDIFEYWQSEFTDFIYEAERHEVNAQTQEVKSYVDRMSFEKFRKSKYWSKAKKMQEYSVDKFLIGLRNKFESESIPISKTKDMKANFVLEYDKLIRQSGEKPSLKPETLMRMSESDFYKFFEKKIKESGTKLIRNYCRLYALKSLEK
jgi:hypothetical protein